jgi:site-specific recombinase XerD
VKLSECIEQYVAYKRMYGTYSQLAATLRRFARHAGDPNIEAITVSQVAAYIEMPRTGLAGWHQKYNLLRNFFLYCRGRYSEASLPLPPKRESPPTTSHIHHVYSRAEIRSLIRAIPEAQQSAKCVIEVRTYRTFLIFLYGTGAQIRESLNLIVEDVDLKKRELTFRDGKFGRERTIPIGTDLYRELSAYINHRKRVKTIAKQLFIDAKGRAPSRATVGLTFKRILRVAAIRPSRGSEAPRLGDLRTAFVVHRLSAWCKSSTDMLRMSPALAAYIGQVGLTSTDRYMRLTSERFSRHLNILSPQRCRGRHWRENAKLMRFLDGL